VKRQTGAVGISVVFTEIQSFQVPEHYFAQISPIIRQLRHN